MNDDKSPPIQEFPEREIPTRPGNPNPRDDGYDTSFLKDDSTFSQAVKIVAKAARAMEADREERRQRDLSELQAKRELHAQHEAILSAITTADRNNTTNYMMVRDELRLLKQSDINQDSKIAQLEKLPATIEERIASLRDEILAKMPEAVQLAMRPYVVRLDALEKEAAERAV